MITAIDTNILLDILVPGAVHAEQSAAQFDACQGEGAVILTE